MSRDNCQTFTIYELGAPIKGPTRKSAPHYHSDVNTPHCHSSESWNLVSNSNSVCSGEIPDQVWDDRTDDGGDDRGNDVGEIASLMACPLSRTQSPHLTGGPYAGSERQGGGLSCA